MAGTYTSDFERLLATEMEDPDFRAAFADEQAFHRVLDRLVEIRRSSGLTQATVASRMGVKQPTVSGFENESADPKLMTLFRYARAVGAQIQIDVLPPSGKAIARSATYESPSAPVKAVAHSRPDASLAEVIDLRAFQSDPSKSPYRKLGRASTPKAV